MSNEWINDDQFKSREAYIVSEISALADKLKLKVHRIPVDLIVQVGVLEPGYAWEKPDCIPWDPASPGIQEWRPVKVPALVKEVSIPPMLFPETLGALIKEQNERWLFTSQDLTYKGDTLKTYTVTPPTPLEELSPDDLLLLKAKEIIKDNAKMETVLVTIPNGKIGNQYFVKFICRDYVCPNIWKEQYVMKDLGLPVWLKAHPRIPTTDTTTVTISKNFCPSKAATADISASGTLLGANEIAYKSEPGSGDPHNADDKEAHCRCYGLQAIILQYMVKRFAPLAEPGALVVDEVPGNFKLAKLWIGGVTVTYPVSPDSTLDENGYLTSGTVYWISKVDILKIDVFVNDNFMSHIFCGVSGRPPTPEPTAPTCVPVSWAESIAPPPAT